MTCRNCGKPTSNPKYCSLKCAATVNNRRLPKRTAGSRICVDCCAPFPTTIRRKRCDGCFDKWKNQRVPLITNDNEPKQWSMVGTRTLGEMEVRVKGKHPSWRWSEVRSHCRRVNSFRQKACEICGYSNHVEYAHIKPLASFPKTTTLAEVNHPGNVSVLCRNHHWELDHGILKRSDLPIWA